MAKVFISYRRDDSRWVSGRIYDALVAQYGAANVFKDVYTIPLGVDFRKYIGDQVSQCEVMLVIIGQRWLTITDETGNRRLDSAADFTRIEIEQALQRSIPVIPVLVDGIGMPRPEDLPASLEQLAFRNATTVRDPEFPSDMERIVRNIGQTLGETATPAAPSPTANATPPATAQTATRVYSATVSIAAPTSSPMGTAKPHGIEALVLAKRRWPFILLTTLALVGGVVGWVAVESNISGYNSCVNSYDTSYYNYEPYLYCTASGGNVYAVFLGICVLLALLPVARSVVLTRRSGRKGLATFLGILALVLSFGLAGGLVPLGTGIASRRRPKQDAPVVTPVRVSQT
jgi:hypothetical protein